MGGLEGMIFWSLKVGSCSQDESWDGRGRREGVMQVKRVVHSRTLKGEAARHIREPEEASGAGAK